MDEKQTNEEIENYEVYTIGQLAKKVGLRTSALRYYEERGLLHPIRRSQGGYRIYDSTAELRLRFIQQAQRLGFSLEDIRTLLFGWQDGELSGEEIVNTAEERYLELERRVTQLLVLRHELGLFLQDLNHKMSQRITITASSLFDQLLDKVCANPLNQPIETRLNWLLQYTGCQLTSDEGKQILQYLQGRHAHIWQVEDGYNILLVSDDPKVGIALERLAQLESDCQAHAHTSQAPELMHNGEGYLLTVRGKNAFIYVHLFLGLDSKTEIT
jgi:DNA-binding transcriptional MerR regulator